MEKPVFHFGVDYYPEQWPESRWPQDARLMNQAGFNIVRLAEFAWSRLEPREGSFDFDWLDRALEILQGQGMAAVLGTPTASPPPWLMNEHPDLFRVRDDGLRVSFGNRREYCPNHPLYHQHTRRIVSAMAKHFASHPAVIGWQVDNEFGERCYCPMCQARFQEWLQQRYGSLDELNRRWGTIFWSHVYGDWKEIPLPLSTAGAPNPGLALDFRRFVSDSYVSFQQVQVDVLREACPGHFITHNFMGFGYEGLDYYDLAKTLDFVSWDNYPLGFWLKDETAADPALPALGHDAMRGLKGKNYWVMEQQAGASGWETVSPTPRPGQLRLWAYQSIAHGADGVVFFRWRTARYGTEQYWHGLLDHHGQPGRRYDEIKRMGAELRRFGEVLPGAEVKARTAILQSYDSRFAFQIQPNNKRFRYGDHLTDVYQALFHKNVAVNVITPETDLSGYKLVIAPALHVLTEAVADRLTQYVREGGTLVITPRTGVKDDANAVVDQPLPGLLSAICGATVQEYDSQAENVSQAVRFTHPELAGGDPVPARVWCDILEPAGAEVLAVYTEDFYADRPAITRNRYEKGQVVYVGTFGDAGLYEALFGWLARGLELSGPLEVPAGVEVAERRQGDHRLIFILNHTALPQAVSVPVGCTNLLDGSTPAGQVTLLPWDVLLLASKT